MTDKNKKKKGETKRIDNWKCNSMKGRKWKFKVAEKKEETPKRETTMNTILLQEKHIWVGYQGIFVGKSFFRSFTHPFIPISSSGAEGEKKKKEGVICCIPWKTQGDEKNEMTRVFLFFDCIPFLPVSSSTSVSWTSLISFLVLPRVILFSFLPDFSLQQENAFYSALLFYSYPRKVDILGSHLHPFIPFSLFSASCLISHIKHLLYPLFPLLSSCFFQGKEVDAWSIFCSEMMTKKKEDPFIWFFSLFRCLWNPVSSTLFSLSLSFARVVRSSSHSSNDFNDYKKRSDLHEMSSTRDTQRTLTRVCL